MTTTDATETFSAQLRAQTSGEHRSAEQNPFMTALLRGTLPLAGYTDMLAQHAYLYEALEAPADAVATDASVTPFLHPGLLRSAALEADLTALVGDDWRSVHPASPATERYVARVAEVGADWPGGYVAHHYTRYLGDLSGGQFIGRIAAKAYDLTPGVSDNFARFDALGDLDEFKTGYRAALDAAPWDAEEQTRVLAEIRAAYAFNEAVFEDLIHHAEA
jgi:heme oxygenase